MLLQTVCYSLVLNLGLVHASAPSIAIKNGTIRGTVCNGIDTSVYRAIPYAQPPVGDLRFLPPLPVNTSFPKDGLDATRFKATCIQVPGQFDWSLPYQSEDCLTLTVYVPPGTTHSSKLPVKVWVHGGGDTGGSASYPLYDLCHMATDSIAVAVQYRLGPFGWLALDSAGIEGNMGIKDAMLALEWVQSNIAAFGGDPKKVVLFGQSSGADDVYSISTLPQAKSLITSVICESGGGLDLPPNDTTQLVGTDYARRAKCGSSDLACLQSKSVEDLLNVYHHLPIFSHGQGTFKNPELSSWADADFPNYTFMATPYLDGKLFKKQPLVVGPQVPILMGSNLYDGSLFAVPPFFEVGGPITGANYTKFLTQFKHLAPAIAKQFPLSAFNSSGSTATAVIEALTYIETKWSYTCFTYRSLRSAKNSGVPAYAYTFAHQLSCPWLWVDGNPFPTKNETEFIAQPMHTAELPLVFGNLYNQPFGNGSCNLNQDERLLSEMMKASWTAMAETGNPSTSNFTWTRWNECSSHGAYIQDKLAIQELDFSVCEFWDQINYELGGTEIPWPGNKTCDVAPAYDQSK